MKIDWICHATLRIEIGNRVILTDPWIEGPAFMGSWIQNPQPKDIDYSEITDVIITHEHSDHFHVPTLQKIIDSGFDGWVHLPDYGDKRLEKRLNKNFDYLDEYWGAWSSKPGSYNAVNSMSYSFIKSRKIWMDHALVIEDEDTGETFLNVNDAGVIHDIPDGFGDVDYIAQSFSQGASSYPLAWAHKDDEEKKEILDQRNKGLLKEIQLNCEKYEPEWFMPFASMNTLYRKEHDEYRKMNAMHRNGFEAVDEVLPDTTRMKAPGIPGTDSVHQLREKWPPDSYYPDPKPMTRETFGNYFITLFENHPSISELINDRLVVHIGDSSQLKLMFLFEDGEFVKYAEHGSKRFPPFDYSQDAQIDIEVDLDLIKEVIQKNLSWDELHIGYYGSYERDPDQHNVYFWYILHTPFLCNSPHSS